MLFQVIETAAPRPVNCSVPAGQNSSQACVVKLARAVFAWRKRIIVIRIRGEIQLSIGCSDADVGSVMFDAK
jgi:hypothetical protein